MIKKVVRKENEGFESLVRRFNRLVQENKVLSLVKERQFYQKPPTKRELREAALRKKHNREMRRKRQMGSIR